MLDRFVNGDPTNDDANGTAWEHDLYGTQLRHGGDVKGLQDTLDYLVSMGIKVSESFIAIWVGNTFQLIIFCHSGHLPGWESHDKFPMGF